ncbi:hypothetical protein ACSBR2_038679 [Camellia fascicularis]
MKSPFKGIINDFKGRKACYMQDWLDAFSSGSRILAPTTYMFFASALPVIVFGEQLNRATDGSLSIVETLASTAICGIIHSIFGGQPLLILGVAEPTVIMVCVWTALLLFLLAVFNACTIINRFTRIAGELFCTLIVVLFMQEAIKGLVSEFKIPKAADPTIEKYHFQWLYTNGLLAIIFSFGLLFTALKSRKARSWSRCKEDCKEELQGEDLDSMEVRHRFVTLTLNLHCKDGIQLKSDYEPFLIEFRMATKFHCRLWGSLYGASVVSIVIQCTNQNSFRRLLSSLSCYFLCHSLLWGTHLPFACEGVLCSKMTKDQNFILVCCFRLHGNGNVSKT